MILTGKSGNTAQLAVNMADIISDNAYCQHGALPQVRIAQLRNRSIKTVLYSFFQTLYCTPPVFE